MVCRKRDWHPTADCEDSDVVTARQFRKLKSDLFNTRGSVPTAQNEIMNRNTSASLFLRLPPEIRLRIYGFVLGDRQLWIGHTGSKTSPKRTAKWSSLDPPYQQHCGGRFYHFDGLGGKLDLRPLRICRQVFMETALLPYALNKFTFERDDVRRAFEEVARPGKKIVQKKAIGEYEIMEWADFQAMVLGISVSGRSEWAGWRLP